MAVAQPPLVAEANEYIDENELARLRGLGLFFGFDPLGINGLG